MGNEMRVIGRVFGGLIGTVNTDSHYRSSQDPRAHVRRADQVCNAHADGTKRGCEPVS